MAILAAHGLARRGLVDFLGMTVVAGNVGIDLAAKNARIVCDWAGEKDFPVYAGAVKPLLRELETAEAVHGKTGLDGTALHEPRCPLQKQHAVAYLVETLSRAEDASMTLCPIGPLTNIALALSIAPEAVRAIKRIVLMGGNYFEAGNMTPAAEFNFFTDPHAAQIVLQSGRSEEHTSELQSRADLVCRLLLEKKKEREVQGAVPEEIGRAHV